MDAQIINIRRQRGIALAKVRHAAIHPLLDAGSKFYVPSATGSGGYIVDASTGVCLCPDWKALGEVAGNPLHRCKHFHAAVVVMSGGDGTVDAVGAALIAPEPEKEYPARNWHATNRCRELIPALGPRLLAELVDGLQLSTPPAPGTKGCPPGRPGVSKRDIIMVALLRAFQNKTAGAAIASAKLHAAAGDIRIGTMPSPNTLLREFGKEEYLQLYPRLVAGSAWPLIQLESRLNATRVYGIDGTGFGTSVYDDYCLDKHGPQTQKRTPTKRHEWAQATMVFGRDTHVVAAIQMTDRHIREDRLMPGLLERVRENGGIIDDLLADALYMNWYCCEAVERIPGARFICRFPEGVTGKTRPAVKRVHDVMMADPEEYARKLKERPKVCESPIHALKTRLAHSLRSRLVESTMIAEGTLLAVAHNVAMLVQAVEEFGIDPKYWQPPEPNYPNPPTWVGEMRVAG